jgi:hypothetical protein
MVRARWPSAEWPKAFKRRLGAAVPQNPDLIKTHALRMRASALFDQRRS